MLPGFFRTGRDLAPSLTLGRNAKAHTAPRTAQAGPNTKYWNRERATTHSFTWRMVPKPDNAPIWLPLSALTNRSRAPMRCAPAKCVALIVPPACHGAKIRSGPGLCVKVRSLVLGTSSHLR